MKRINWIINSWMGLVEVSPITDVKEIARDKEELQLIAEQFEKYDIVSDTSGALIDESIKELQSLTAQIKVAVDEFKSSAEAFESTLDEQEELVKAGTSTPEQVDDKLRVEYDDFVDNTKKAVGESEKAIKMLEQYDETLLAVKEHLSKATLTLSKKFKALETDKFTYQQRYEHCQRACTFNAEVENSKSCKDVQQHPPKPSAKAQYANDYRADITFFIQVRGGSRRISKGQASTQQAAPASWAFEQTQLSFAEPEFRE